jgi:hypothetical protein
MFFKRKGACHPLAPVNLFKHRSARSKPTVPCFLCLQSHRFVATEWGAIFLIWNVGQVALPAPNGKVKQIQHHSLGFEARNPIFDAFSWSANLRTKEKGAGIFAPLPAFVFHLSNSNAT